jgi:glycogen phosphorylase
MIETGVFSPGEPQRFAMLTDALRRTDHYLVVADFDSYWQVQRNVDELWRRPDDWAASCIRNIAGMGWFSADRAINEYARWSGVPAFNAGSRAPKVVPIAN